MTKKKKTNGQCKNAVWFSDEQKAMFEKLKLSSKFSEFVKQAFYDRIDIIKNKGA